MLFNARTSAHSSELAMLRALTSRQSRNRAITSFSKALRRHNTLRSVIPKQGDGAPFKSRDLEYVRKADYLICVRLPVV
jgi:hypothetical protein